MTEGLTQSVTTAMGTVKTDVVSLIGDVLPYALGILGITLAITLAIRFFKKIAK